MNLIAIFITGLTTGGITCAAMQAGLLISAITGEKKARVPKKTDVTIKPQKIQKDDWLPVAMFLATKLIAYTIVGFLLGAVGSAIELSLNTKLTLQIITALYMVATAMNLLDVHPIFRYVVITPPKFIYKKIKQTSRSDSLFAPALLGVFTIFIPCGVTQAMEVLAINSGSPVQGAMIMASFVLGTMPLFTAIGVATAKLSSLWRERFLKTAATLLIGMSLYAINGVLVVLDSPVSLNRIISMYQAVKAIESGQVAGAESPNPTKNIQRVTIDVNSRGYSPTYIRVQKNIPVELTVNTNNVYSCATAFTLRAFNIYQQLKPTDSATFTFTPQKPGRYTYSCSMGMYTGQLEVY